MSKHNLTVLALVVGMLAAATVTLATLHVWPAQSEYFKTDQVSTVTKIRVDPNADRQKVVTFKGVSFIYDSALAASVKTEIRPESLDGKPGDVVPEHIVFRLVGYSRSLKSSSEGEPLIMVFPVAEYRKVMTAYTKQESAGTWPQTDWVPYFDDQIGTLKALISERPAAAKLTAVLNTNRVGINKGQMPFLPMYDAYLAFHGRARYLRFQNGVGVSFLTQWDHGGTFPITKEGLVYVFQGITDNGRHYVSAEFRVTTQFLPSDFEPDVIAWREKNYLLPHASKQYQDYLQPVVRELEALPANKFEPSLTLIERLIQSLKIEAELPGKL